MRDLREMLAVLALDNLLDAEPVGRSRGGVGAARASARRHGPSATGRAPTRSATSCRALGWEIRDGADGPELLPV